jgi:hypothetical protein
VSKTPRLLAEAALYLLTGAFVFGLVYAIRYLWRFL